MTSKIEMHEFKFMAVHVANIPMLLLNLEDPIPGALSTPNLESTCECVGGIMSVSQGLCV